MASNELKLSIVFAFALTATLTPTACFSSNFLITEPRASKFVIPVGTPIDIICNETGEIVETISWRKANSDFLNEGDARVQQIADNSIKLIFTNPTHEDSGKYYCESKYISTYHGLKEFERSEELIEMNFYNPELKFERSFENISAEEGSTLEVNCSAIGDKPIQYEWRNQYQEVIPISYKRRTEPISVFKSKNGSVLKILKINSNITGSYTCKASNKYGLAKKKYEILIRSATEDDKDNCLPIIRHVKVVNVTSNSVQFGFSVSGTVNSIRTRYITAHSTYEDTLYERVWKRGDIYEVKDLLPGYSYFFKFKAVPQNDPFSESDDKGWSEDYEVVMLPVKPDVIFHELLGGSVQISWIRYKDVVGVGKYKLTYVPIKLYTHTRYWTEGHCRITIEIPFCPTVNYTISGLSSNTYYEIQLQAHSDAGYGEAYTQRIYVK